MRTVSTRARSFFMISSIFAVIIWCIAAAERTVLGQAEGISFRVLSSTETGLGEIMQAWHAAELARQGGTTVRGWWPWSAALFDYDRDGDLDLLISQHGVPGGLLAKNEFREIGRISFVSAMPSLGIQTQELPLADGNGPAVWDFNGDGLLDIAGTSDGVRVPSFLAQSDGTFRLAPFRFTPLAEFENIEDFNGDGYLDAWGLSHSQGSPDYKRHTFVYQPPVENFSTNVTPYSAPPEAPPSWSALVQTYITDLPKNRFLRITYWTQFDLNGDGIKDIVLRGHAGYGGVVFGRYCISQPDGACADQTVPMGLPESGAAILIRDLNGDGSLDIVVAKGAGASGAYLNNGAGLFTQLGGDLQRFLGGYDPYLHRVFAIDLDNDGDLDLIASSPRYKAVVFYENVGGGELFRMVLRASGWDSNPITTGDLNDDGLLDIVVGGPTPMEATIYLNTTQNIGNYSNVQLQMDGPNRLAVGALVQAFRAGAMEQSDARPFVTHTAPPAGQPVHIGLGSARRFDLRVLFPDGSVAERANLEAVPNILVTADDGRAFRVPRVPRDKPAAQ
jgi:hypothetical protein